MGEHKSDLSYDELIRQRERQEREREEEEEREIRRQAEEFAKQETGHILSLASELIHTFASQIYILPHISLHRGKAEFYTVSTYPIIQYLPCRSVW